MRYGDLPVVILREPEAQNNKLENCWQRAHLDIHALNTAFEAKRWPHRPSVLPSPP
jgi:hypothetical protein